MRSMSRIYTPSELAHEVRLHIEMGFPRIVLEAEISNLSRPASGHLYFSLKDEKAQIRCALFRSSANRLAIRPENGMKVLAKGRISLYEARGDFQMIVDGLQDAGEGALQRQFEELKRKLQAEGLFEESHKKALPAYPRHIGLVTSPGGAALRDIMHVLNRRWPLANVRLYPASVQGESASCEIDRAIRSADQHGWADVMIIGRGGGSLEDLAAFNDENLARTVFGCSIPLVCAVGHETDFSICDFVADLRAPTPSAAAELVSPDGQQIVQQFKRFERLLHNRQTQGLQARAQHLDGLSHRLAQQHPRQRLQTMQSQLQSLQARQSSAIRGQLRQSQLRLSGLNSRIHSHHPGKKLDIHAKRLNMLAHSLRQGIGRSLQARSDHLREIARTLNAVSPLQVIGRGYAALTAADSGQVISSISQVETSERISAQLADGSLECIVEGKTEAQE